MYCRAVVLLPSNLAKVQAEDHYRFLESILKFF